MWSRAERVNGKVFDMNHLEEVLTEGTFLDSGDARALNNAVREIPGVLLFCQLYLGV